MRLKNQNNPGERSGDFFKNLASTESGKIIKSLRSLNPKNDKKRATNNVNYCNVK